MSKKKKWWERGWGGHATEIEDTYSNTIKQHQKKFDEDGIETFDEEDFEYDYGWNLDKKLIQNSGHDDGSAEYKDNKYAMVKSDYNDSYEKYKKTGVWGGYAKVQQLSYKYVQQMANALAAQHKINVEVGNTWHVDLIHKKLTYNPASLIYGTKSELLATLMHEIGKLRYVKHSSLLKNKYLTMYDLPAREVLSIYEDVRTDYLMLKSYESASEIYESVIPAIETQVKAYMDKGRKFRTVIYQITENIFQNIENQYRTDSNGPFRGGPDPSNPEYERELLQTFGTSNPRAIENNLRLLKEDCEKNGSIYEYCGKMLSEMYDLDEQHHEIFVNINEKVEKSLDTIEVAKKMGSSQEMIDYLDQTTYPIVEDLMKDHKEKKEALEKAFPEMPQKTKSWIKQLTEQTMNGGGYGATPGQGVGTQQNSRTSGKSDNQIPPEWMSGDYKVLKDSVSMEIKQLINKLTFLRRDELTVRYEPNQRRGRLNMKSLYKSATGSRRLFKKKLQNTDTIQSFAFSILIDVSGSMSGQRIIHTTRGLIILAEVFKKMNIPFELVAFADGPNVIKSFESEVTKDVEREIGGMPKHLGGGTNLEYGLDALKVHERPERNKVVIVLTDGGVGQPSEFDTRYFEPWLKNGIKSVGFGVECEKEMAQLCMGNSKLLDNASQLPVEFSNLLKEVIKR